MSNNILFWKGNKSDFTAIEHSSNTIYFILDELSIYVGDVEVSNNKLFFIETIRKRYQDIIDKFQWPEVVGPEEDLFSVTIVVKDEEGALLTNIDVIVEGNRYTTNDNGECVVKVSKGDVVIRVENGMLDAKEIKINVTEDTYIEVVFYAPNKTYLVFSVSDGEVLSIGLSPTDFIEVNWGDGNIDSGTAQHTYEKGGLYDVVITHNEDTSLFFGYNTNLKEVKSLGMETSMNGVFDNCTNLTKIHQGAFDNCVNATTFYACFRGCTSLSTIPNGLFDNHVNVTDFSSCFEGCESLTSTPQGLFDKNVNVTDFSYCFSGCSSLDQPYNLTSPHLPKLWEREGVSGDNFAANAHGTFRATVPEPWGGGIKAHVKFSIVNNGEWYTGPIGVSYKYEASFIDCEMSDDLVYRTIISLDKNKEAYIRTDYGDSDFLIPFETNFTSSDDLDLGVLYVGDNSQLSMEELNFSTMSNEELSNITSELNNWTIDTVNGETGLTNTIFEPQLSEDGYYKSTNNLLSFKDVLYYDYIYTISSNLGNNGVIGLNNDKFHTDTYMGMEEKEPMSKGVIKSLTAIILEDNPDDKFIIKKMAKYIPPAKP